MFQMNVLKLREGRLKISMISYLLSQERRLKTFSSLCVLSETIPAVEKEQSLLESKNPYYNKYKEKLQHLKASNPHLYAEKLSALREGTKPELKPQTDPETMVSAHESKRNTMRTKTKLEARPSSTASYSQDLNRIVKVDLLKDLECDEIENIWKQYHAKKNYVCALIKTDCYTSYRELLNLYPRFLLALPRDDGFEFFYTQSLFSSLLFTKLSSYQTYQENSPIVVSCQFYSELSEEKGVILMRGEYDPEVVNPLEAQTLVNQHRLFYFQKKAELTADEKERLNLVKLFNEYPNNFDYNDVIKLMPGC